MSEFENDPTIPDETAAPEAPAETGENEAQHDVVAAPDPAHEPAETPGETEAPEAPEETEAPEPTTEAPPEGA